MGIDVVRTVIDQVFYALYVLVIGAVVLSWLVLFRVVSPYSPLVRFVFNITEPLFAPFRRVLPPTMTGGLDLSPVLLLIVLQLLHQILLQMLR